MRSTKEVEHFPYSASTVCYFLTDSAGKVSQVMHQNKSDLPLLQAAYQKVLAGEASMYAVWPGKWRSDLFTIDDLPAFAAAFGF